MGHDGAGELAARAGRWERFLIARIEAATAEDVAAANRPGQERRIATLLGALRTARRLRFETFHRDATASEADRRWRDRLVFDPAISTTWPVVKGTWVTAGQVVSLVLDGWSWGRILRSYPELTEDDLRACLSYRAEQHEGEA